MQSRNLLLALWCAVVAASCVTSGDLRDIAREIDQVERVAADRYATDDDVSAAFRAASKAIEDKAHEIEERTRDSVTGLGAAADGGIVGLLGALGVHLYRNSTRRKALAGGAPGPTS